MKRYRNRFMNVRKMTPKWVIFAISITLFINVQAQRQTMLLELFVSIQRRLEELVRRVKSFEEIVVEFKRSIDNTIRELENLVDHIKFMEEFLKNTTEEFDEPEINNKTTEIAKQISNTTQGNWTNLSEDEKKQALEICREQEEEKIKSVDELKKKLAQALLNKKEREIREQAYLKQIEDLEIQRENLTKIKTQIDRNNEQLKKSIEKDKGDLQQLAKEVSELKNSEDNKTKEYEEAVKEVEERKKVMVNHENKNWEEKRVAINIPSRITQRQISQASQDDYEKCQKNVNELIEKEGELKEDLLDAVQDEFVKSEEEKNAQNWIKERQEAIAKLQNSTYEAQELNNQLNEQLKNNTEERKKLRTLINNLDIKIKELEEKYRKRKKNEIPKNEFWVALKNGIISFLDFKRKLISFLVHIKQLKLQKLQSIIKFVTGGLLGAGC